jgi:hypothetical protein
MLNSIPDCQTNLIVFRKLNGILGRRSSRPNLLISDMWRALYRDRNPVIHDSRTRVSLDDARRYIALCAAFFTILEDPPATITPEPTGRRPVRVAHPRRPESPAADCRQDCLYLFLENRDIFGDNRQNAFHPNAQVIVYDNVAESGEFRPSNLGICGLTHRGNSF